MTLAECCLGDTDKAWHGYLPFYELHLNPDEVSTLTEIGVWTGGSLRMWARWLPQADIVGVDIDPSNYVVPSENNPPNVSFVEADATTMQPWESDVVIDDGSHHGDDQLAVFDRFWPLLTPGGWYVIEDLETVWTDDFRCGSEMVSFLSHRLERALRPSGDIVEAHAYEQILFLRKAGR